MTIEMLKPEKIWFKNLVFDEENPNEMSEEQDEGLGESLTEFGYLGDLIVVNTKDAKGRQIVHHGEHRIKKLMSFGNEWAWGFVKKMNELQHRLYRQTMNNLRGQHDPEKQKAEIAYFEEHGKLTFLSKLIAIPQEILLLTQETAPLITTDKPMLQHHEDTFLQGNLKQLHFIFNNEEFLKIMKKMEKLKEDFKTDNHTDIFVKLVDFYFKQKKK